MGVLADCTEDEPCSGCAPFLKQPYYRETQDRKLFHKWIWSDRGMDMDWEEYQQWHCPECREWMRLRNNHHA